MELKEQTLKDKLSTEISSKLEEAFETVIKQKNAYYQQNPENLPTTREIKGLISSVALKNSAISGGANLVPGPWGMLAVVPELILVIKNQIGLIYDIAAAHGQRNMMTKELAATILLSGLGTTTGSLLVVQGGKYLIKRSSLRVFQRIIVALGGKVTQQVLKSTISKWLPGVGAAAMAAWSNYMTKKIGQKANEIFSAGIIEEDGIEDISISNEPEEVTDITNEEATDITHLEFIRLKVLTNLAKIDGNLDEDEAEFISSLIDKSELSEEQKTEIISRLATNEKNIDGIEILAQYPDDAISLISDMLALAHKDDNLHITEKLYIKQIAKLINISETDIEELFSSFTQ